MIAGSTHLYQQIVESAHEGIWLHDLDGQTIYANPQMAELMSYSLLEMYSLTIFDLLDDDGQLQAVDLLERQRRTPSTEQVDCQYLRKDGAPVWCLVNHSPLRDSAGRHIGSINLVSNITDRKLVDEKLRQSGELLDMAQRVAHLGSWTWELRDHDAIEWSDEVHRILGRTPGPALTYEGYLAFIHPDDVEMVRAKVMRILAGDSEFSYECRLVRPDGCERWIHAEGEPVNDSAGVTRWLRGTLLDITPYKTAQQEAQRTASRYRLLQRMATAANKDLGFEEVLNLAVQEILLHTRWPVGRAYLVSGDPARLATAPLRESDSDSGQRTTLPRLAFETGRPRWTVQLEHGNGAGHPTGAQRRYEAGFAFPVLVGSEVVAVLEFLADEAAIRDEELLETCEQVGTQLARVVGRQRAADHLAAARDAAMESLRVKSEFLATMSHEIRTPMNGVIGLTNLLLHTSLDERQRQYADGVHLSADALLTVINDILDLSKLEAGKVELDYEDFEVRRVLEEMAVPMAPAAHAKDLELLAYCLPEVPAVLVGDSGRIRQILLNLVSNGIKFTSVGEVVTKVTSAPLDDGGVTIRFEVRDTGIGIPEQSRERLFESFSQVDASTTRRYGGSGLGLAISRRLVQAMGGTIGFDSEVGAGSTFWFEIPLGLGTRLPAQTLAVLPAELADLRVLVVDDNATNRMILEAQLTSWQLRVDVVGSAPAALAQLRAMAEQREPYAIAVLDMCMPGVDGLQLAIQVSADPALSGTRMIMLTSTSELDPAALARAGVSESLLKPVRNADLYERLVGLVAPGFSPEPVAVPIRHSEPAGPRSSGRILVVEDNPMNQLVAEGMVTALGYACDIVENGAEALRSMLHTYYIAVLMDCHMPVLDGFEATREIRRREGGGDRIPVIAMTAAAMAEDRERCLAAGMDDFVTKPVTLGAMKSALAQWARPSGEDLWSPVTTAYLEPDSPPWAGELTLDLDRITQLRQLGSLGGNNLLGQVAELFALDGGMSLGAIREATSTRSFDCLKHELHKLKGSSDQIGANRVAALCRQLEVQTIELKSIPETDAMPVTSQQLDHLEIELANANRAIARVV